MKFHISLSTKLLLGSVQNGNIIITLLHFRSMLLFPCALWWKKSKIKKKIENSLQDIHATIKEWNSRKEIVTKQHPSYDSKIFLCQHLFLFPSAVHFFYTIIIGVSIVGSSLCYYNGDENLWVWKIDCHA